ncbi:Arginine kinase [Aphelenchoides besseyi]|nr:Arginine kinase [Aphelenchoides besseyi]KAI6208430.1 Arginine kinase [Aphelenchoides besseyi]
MALRPKTVGAVVAAGAAGFLGYHSYTYTRELVKVNQQIDEANAFEVRKVEDAFKTLQSHPECRSLLAKNLTKDIVDKLKYKKTKLGATLYDVIRSGVENLDAGVGVYALDAESYKTFAPLFDRIIEDYHGFKPTDRQPAVDLGENRLAEFPPLDPEGKYIVSTRIRCGRSIRGYPFNPLLSEDDYLVMQQKIKNALEKIEDKELAGVYYPLSGMAKEVQQQLISDHFLFKSGDRHLEAAKACNYWPKGRGIFHNNAKDFLIWVNEEDHLRLISMEKGSDVGKVLDRLIRGIKAIESKVPFARDERLGWLTFCPTNLGSTVRASVHIKLPKLSARKDFKEICEQLNLQPRGIHGEHSDSEGGIYDISNKARLGKSEVDCVKEMYDGVKKLIEMEKSAS